MRISIAKLFAICAVIGGLAWAAGPSGLWLDVPFVKQERNGCGAACISMLMQYWSKCHGQTTGASADASTIQRSLYSRAAGGIFAGEMERYLQQAGFRTFAFKGEWRDLQQHLAKGRPLVVCLEENSRRGPLHYVVVTGLDWQRNLVMVNDPAQRKLLEMDQATFERSWNATDHWTLLALPPQAH